ncbi:MAG: hypothetical protein OHK0013_17910 [Sandaracinaceae bacterium]
MTTIRTDAFARTLLPATTTEELLAEVQQQALDDQAEASVGLRQLARAARNDAQARQIGALRAAADLQLFAKIASATATFASAAGQLSQSAASMRGASDAASAMWGANGKSVDATMQIIGGFLEKEASIARTQATQAEHAATEASETLAQSRDDLRGAHDASDRGTQMLGEVLRERRRAEEAATRA